MDSKAIHATPRLGTRTRRTALGFAKVDEYVYEARHSVVASSIGKCSMEPGTLFQAPEAFAY